MKTLFTIFVFSLLVFSPVSIGAESVNGSVADYFDNNNENKEFEKEIFDETTTLIEESNEDSKVGITTGDILRTIFSLLFVIALLYFFLKWLQKRNNAYPTSQVVRNLGGANVGNNKSVQLIQVGKSILVVGVGENIQLLKEIQEETERNSILEKYEEKTQVNIAPDLFTKFLSKNKSNQENEPPTSFKYELQQQLDTVLKERKKLLNKDEGNKSS